MQVVIQVILNVPDGTGKALTGHEYEEIIADLVEDQVELGKISGVASCNVVFEDCV